MNAQFSLKRFTEILDQGKLIEGGPSHEGVSGSFIMQDLAHYVADLGGVPFISTQARKVVQ